MKSIQLLRLMTLVVVAAFAVAMSDTAEAGLFDRLRTRGGDCCEPAPCCEPVVVCCEPAPCCEPDPCCKRKGLLDRLRSRRSDCCCEPAPCCASAAPVVVEEAPAPPAEEAVVEVAPCCEPAPCCEVDPCCDSGRKLGGRLKSRLGGLRNRGGDCCGGCGC